MKAGSKRLLKKYSPNEIRLICLADAHDWTFSRLAQKEYNPLYEFI